MTDKTLCEFYANAVLPQFGMKDFYVTWTGSQQAGPDEFIHYFKINNIDYALIFEDYDGIGRNDDFIRENVLERHTKYEYVEPISATSQSPTYSGFRLPPPSQYCENVTGSFTLLKLFL